MSRQLNEDLGEREMCEYCHEEYCCLHGRHRFHRRYYYERPSVYYERPPIYYERPTPETRREYLEDEKKLLERRLKEIQDALAESTKS